MSTALDTCRPSVAGGTKIPVTAMIFTLDEAIHMPSCLRALAWCDDVVVVDSFSRDATEAVSRQYGARFFQHAFNGFGSQRNWALDHTTPKHEWILILDADERVTPELRDEMGRVLPHAPENVAAYRLKRRFHMWGRWLKHSSLYPTWVVRLIRRGRVRYVNRGHAETQEVDGDVDALEHDLIDENLKGIEVWFARQARYALREAEYELEHEAHAPTLRSLLSSDPLERRAAAKRVLRRLPARSLAYFLYSYVVRGAYLEGKDGLVYSGMKAVYQQMIVASKHELRRSGTFRP